MPVLNTLPTWAPVVVWGGASRHGLWQAFQDRRYTSSYIDYHVQLTLNGNFIKHTGLGHAYAGVFAYLGPGDPVVASPLKRCENLAFY
jgi:hypothetical protein